MQALLEHTIITEHKIVQNELSCLCQQQSKVKVDNCTAVTQY